MSTSIAIDGVRKVFVEGPSPAVAVDGVTLAIEPGELFFLLGPSGCGKTTLLRILAGFVEPDAGRVLFGGRDVTRVPANRRNTGMVFQSYALWPHMTVEDNVAFGLSVRRIPRVERERRVSEALEAVQMREYAKRRPGQLSGGQQQRVALARALVVRPEVLLLDEPLSNLDAKLRAELRARIRRVCKEFLAADGSPGITTVYVTHDQKEALSMADRIAVMDRGRIAQVGSPRDLYRRPASRFVAEFLGECNLIAGRVAGEEGGGIAVETPAGRLVSANPPTAAGDGRVLCCIRPEALRIAADVPGAGVNRLAGQLIETTYLGELAHHVIEVGGVALRVAALNADPADGAAGGPVTLHVRPQDVVLLPDSAHGAAPAR